MATGGRSGPVALEALAVLFALVVGGACAYILAFAVAAVFRLGYPFPLEITEGASLEGVRRILNRQALCGPA